eukprot:TRINITY_DN33207_c0_g1_i1.p1 TRINITY_DN33207_c0_g1~~TRINITY_DN33207_c0_g1_i1.p1  ORF type:complete len:485 (-),score=104.36 TRINITY_DN33207_c0_g1_i1:148-1602(-)
MQPYNIIVAAAASADGTQLGIGKGGEIPWHLPADLAYFRQVTSYTVDPAKENAVIMGRKTWDSIPSKFRPLKDRLNIVVSRDEHITEETLGEGVVVARDLVSAIAGPRVRQCESAFVIGGATLYNECLTNPELAPYVAQVYLTRVEQVVECDTFLAPAFTNLSTLGFTLKSSIREPTQKSCKFERWVRPVNTCPKPHAEYQYLDMVRDIIEHGVERNDRTGTGTRALFGTRMEYDLTQSFPLLTSKRVFWRAVAEELLWFVSGATNAKLLQDKGIKIWDGNASREFLDSIGLTDREPGDLGPVYGFQWRHFGAEYKDMHTDYTGQGVDQLAEVIDKIKNKPCDRRIILSAWNPAAIPLMALPPCHMFCQFFVDTQQKTLSCQMYQRSADMGLGVPFNIASYSLLTYMIAHVCNLTPGKFVHIIGDAHVYNNHIEPLRQQLQQSPRPFPKLNIKRKVDDIDGFTYDDFEIVDYQPHKSIKMAMSA